MTGKWRKQSSRLPEPYDLWDSSSMKTTRKLQYCEEKSSCQKWKKPDKGKIAYLVMDKLIIKNRTTPSISGWFNMIIYILLDLPLWAPQLQAQGQNTPVGFVIERLPKVTEPSIVTSATSGFISNVMACLLKITLSSLRPMRYGIVKNV